ncbi:MAG: hypothetical protein AB1798_01585 [Spirochaetota bacterium]
MNILKIPGNAREIIIVLSAIFMLFIPGIVVFADGGGGITFGYQISQYPFFKNYTILNNNMGLIYYGGFGYGIQEKHGIKGGFGYVLMDAGNGSKITGGFGGIVNGLRIIRFPLHVAIVSWTGFGGVYTGRYETTAGKAFFCVSEELELEIGIPLLSWFMPTIYAGYQVTGNVIPGSLFQTFLSYTPVIGFRIVWGKFY